ncbi:lactonase family protein [Devosia faecipullorum]|uniref:lactonase family protein n=1 Tax=Devosia faecipullorum TaxID=2755039 RepID=UPI00187BBD27|nr:beta-propeller fold lactonase family protein [Devosia faecipullorum]MBE7731569.1 beta-propeller fold lactonase family protein [Devosia faecipullorum]
MSGKVFESNEVLLVASRGVGDEHGLWLWTEGDAGWSGHQIDTVGQLSSLAAHPSIPVIYGTAGVEEGRLFAWHIDSSREERIAATLSMGVEPCDLTVDPSGRLLIAVNYTTSTLTLQKLGPDGTFDGPVSLVKLSGSGPDASRQEDAHPHQAFFKGETLIVIDLGADCVREFTLDLTKDNSEILTEVRTTPVPPGTGPRHGVILEDGRLAVSGELGEILITGHLGGTAGDWANIRSTQCTGPAKSRWERNYPGDIRRSADGRHVYLANRSYDTLATFDVSAEEPKLIGEVDTGVHWPQHIAVRPDCVLVAGWDSSRVVMLPLEKGSPQQAVPIFDCAGASWLHVHRMR